MNPAPLTIRTLTENDIDTFHALRLQATIDTPFGIVPTLEEEARWTREENIARVCETDRQAVFGAFDGAALVGIVGWRREARQKLAHKSHIWGVFVQPAYRRAGIARRLMERAIEHARASGVEQVQLTVGASNPRAQSLYRSLGFAIYGTEPRAMCIDGEYFDEEHMLLMLD
ncbi:Mycothiol acetyltransferase [Paraburkholderia caffeinitolerans]|uniref:Mycothiol acetyltransferase n=1 Tax=Paraburkholderia caffeinitolerans TaxID=1723730 RepID=A0A6J5GSS0_9BURK|nr:GNAT family N-acetyltransferase [Paraburkholderia caffeinitolerans]CAB3803038.1 Mycothiol acetyltransferase [Paraburkholderia caffeinitolerans]